MTPRISSSISVLIVGAGITGLTSALALNYLGISVKILEQATNFTNVGAGIQIGPNGFKVLTALGLSERIKEISTRPIALETKKVNGQTLFRIALEENLLTIWGGDYRHIYRPALIKVLERALIERGIIVQFGQKVETLIQSSDKAQVKTTTNQNFEADLVLLCDGYASKLRQTILPFARPRFSGYQAWRGLINATLLSDFEKTACVWSGKDAHAVTYSLSPNPWINFVGLERTKAPEFSKFIPWQEAEDRASALKAFQNFPAALQNLMSQAETLRAWPLFELAPLSRWHQGRIMVLGDAAHPMLPSMAQGASQGMEDAITLAACLHSSDTLDQALHKTYKRRISRTAKAQNQARANIALFHQQSHGKAMLSSLASNFNPSVLTQQLNWLYSWDPPKLDL